MRFKSADAEKAVFLRNIVESKEPIETYHADGSPGRTAGRPSRPTESPTRNPSGSSRPASEVYR